MVTKLFFWKCLLPLKGHQGWNHISLITDRSRGSWSVSWHVNGAHFRAHLFFLLITMFIPLVYPHLLDGFWWTFTDCYWRGGNVTGLRSNLIAWALFTSFNTHDSRRSDTALRQQKRKWLFHIQHLVLLWIMAWSLSHSNRKYSRQVGAQHQIIRIISQ